MQIFLHVIAVLLIVNFVSCAVVRLYWGGKFIVDIPDVSNSKRPRVFLISGLKSQPQRSYAHISFCRYDKAYLKFSLLGYNPKRAGRQIGRVVNSGDAVCGLCLGAKAIEYSSCLGQNPVVLVNPCSSRCLMKPRTAPYYWSKYLVPVLEIISWSIGWIAVLPLLNDDMGSKTSIALIADQLFWSSRGHPNCEYSRTNVIISALDEYLLIDSVYEYYRYARQITIDSPHGRIGSRKYASAYEKAINAIL